MAHTLDIPYYVLVKYFALPDSPPPFRIQQIHQNWKVKASRSGSCSHPQRRLGEGHWPHQEALSIMKHTVSHIVFISFFLRWNSCVVCRCLNVLRELGLSSLSLCCWMQGSSKSPRSSPGCPFELFCEEVPGCRSPLPLAPALAF